MRGTNDQHERALDLADQADNARGRGDYASALGLMARAALFEKDAAELAVEPARSGLYLSASVMALEAGDLAEAIRLVGWGLSGHPDRDTKTALLQMLEELAAYTEGVAVKQP